MVIKRGEMILGKLQQVITMEIYDKDGNFLGKKAEYIYKPILMWYEVVAGLLVAFIVFTQSY
jgi:hypothetical protein